MKKRNYNLSQSQRITDGTSQVIALKFEWQGIIACVRVLAATDQTSSPTRIDFGYVRGAVFVPIYSSLAPAIGQSVGLYNEIWFAQNETPGVRFVGAGVGDLVQIVLSGYVLFDDWEKE